MYYFFISNLEIILINLTFDRSIDSHMLECYLNKMLPNIKTEKMYSMRNTISLC